MNRFVKNFLIFLSHNTRFLIIALGALAFVYIENVKNGSRQMVQTIIFIHDFILHVSGIQGIFSMLREDFMAVFLEGHTGSL